MPSVEFPNAVFSSSDKNVKQCRHKQRVRKCSRRILLYPSYFKARPDDTADLGWAANLKKAFYINEVKCLCEVGESNLEGLFLLATFLLVLPDREYHADGGAFYTEAELRFWVHFVRE